MGRGSGWRDLGFVLFFLELNKVLLVKTVTYGGSEGEVRSYRGTKVAGDGLKALQLWVIVKLERGGRIGERENFVAGFESSLWGEWPRKG